MTFLQDLRLNPSSFVFCRCRIIFQNHRLYYLTLVFFLPGKALTCVLYMRTCYQSVLFLTVTLKPSRQSECLTVNCRKYPKYKKVINTQNSSHLLIHISKLFNPTQSVLSSGNLAQLGSRKLEVGSRKSEVGRPFSAFVQDEFYLV